jgi:hypothetical protein
MTGKWPPLPLDEWRETCATLHMWSQIVGKIALALTPLTNHFWNIAFLLNSRGFMTHPLVADNRTLTIAFDFIEHQLVIQCSDGTTETLALKPQTVAAFYRHVLERMNALGVRVTIWPMPVEIPSPIRFDQDVAHASYDAAAVSRFWLALVSMRPVFDRFRARFTGKSSPVHFFWGSFDLASTRFSGRRAPERPGADKLTREAYSHEVISHGFWLGSGPVQEPAFYAYAAPEPAGLRERPVRPEAASYHQAMNEFVLPYEAVRRSPSPEDALQAFLESTYDAAATLAKWDRHELERS